MSQGEVLYLDANVWIAAAREGPEGGPATALFLRGEIIASSPFVRMETRPGPHHNKRAPEQLFFALFEKLVDRTPADYGRVVELAEAECLALRHLEPMDALHLAAAAVAGSTIFVTLERPGKPMYRSKLVRVRHLLDMDSDW